ncbi:hypothetical protein [Parvularcula marina]|jgi:hypothetical protein|uniref:Uncharacterized protein n=1 Tax=Parvularcula marina TaxID=2292771 RepID=A0A371R7Z0_9PROT|nr:hypothetical protein [Parvularcula marina]RFB01566.1 hypothetical protein DX908_14895 [Parvularcula marina]
MAYGEKKAPKSLEEYGLADKLGLGLASAVGIAVATIADLLQADDASSLFLFNKWVASLTDTLGIGALPLYAVVLLLMAIGGTSIMYFQPVTMRGAFATGFASLAVLMNLAPSDLGAPLPGTMDDMDEAGFDQPLPPSDDLSFDEDVSFTPSTAPALLVPIAMAAQSSAVDGYSIRIKITFPDGLDKDVRQMINSGGLRGRLHNEGNGATYNLFRSGGGDVDFRNNTLYVATRLPGTAPTTTLVARIEAEGYRIAEERFDAKKGPNPIWQINMDPGGGPLFLQRLNRPYRF